MLGELLQAKRGEISIYIKWKDFLQELSQDIIITPECMCILNTQITYIHKVKHITSPRGSSLYLLKMRLTWIP